MIIQHEIKQCAPDKIGRDEWQLLHGIGVEAYAHAFRRSPDEVAHLTLANDFDTFYDQQLDPNKRLTDEPRTQEYSNPVVAVAYCEGNPVGYGFAANNTSGNTQAIRTAKYASVKKRYFWVSKLVVSPQHQQRLQETAKEYLEPQERVGLGIARILIGCAARLQPVTAYTYPGEYKAGHDKILTDLERIGFEPTGSAMVDAFNTGDADTHMVRMQAPWAWGVQYRLTQMPRLHQTPRD
jgi:hypothetical protein